MPTARFVSWYGAEHVLNEPPLNEHWKVAASSAEKKIGALELSVLAGGPESMNVCGSVVSGGGATVHV